MRSKDSLFSSRDNQELSITVLAALESAVDDTIAHGSGSY